MLNSDELVIACVFYGITGLSLSNEKNKIISFTKYVYS
ncbi:hypothetical protein BCH308197_A0212 (plasmid) [Bacillus cereus H3081.97]|uniref:Uncharacterized protein n=1 Tax=Bacillus cereus (strain AH187) TaxID=405534 RepID=B7I118_BACC7|nr:hypothetical protein BCH308197_A0212 [Bacillus cereus H3081.97]ACJ82710.1 hypothetical protein BCAH187_C0046 [Bacillus cereus AH187]KZD75998.1 hypothetical protein B4155_4219 [Bacillus cereus]